LQVVLRYPRRPAYGPSRFDVQPAARTSPPEVGLPCAPEFASLRFFRLAFTVRSARAPRLIDVTVHTGSRRVIRRGLSCARRSATRDVEPHTTGPGLAFFAFSPATLMGFWMPFAVFPAPRVPAFVTTPCDGVGAVGGVSAVHPHLPLSTSFRVPLIFTAVDRANLNSFQSSFHSAKRSTAERSDRLLGICRGQAEPTRAQICSTCRRPANPAMGFAGLLSGVSGAFSQHAGVARSSNVRTANRRGPLSVGRHPLVGFACD
jgi:hypothetical protein